LSMHLHVNPFLNIPPLTSMTAPHSPSPLTSSPGAPYTRRLTSAFSFQPHQPSPSTLSLAQRQAARPSVKFVKGAQGCMRTGLREPLPEDYG
jgi:hypothetical protein